MKSKHKTMHYVLLSLLGLVIPLALGLYHREVSGGEGYHQFYTFPKAKARPIALTYGEDGILHRWISPHALGGTIGLTNTGKPAKIKMRMVGVPDGLKIHWENSHTRDFDLATQTVERTLNRGDSVSVHHTFFFGELLRKKKVIFNGALEIVDATNNQILLTIPFRILNAGNVPSNEPEAPCHES
jgi:hypothetical protein